MAFVKATKSQGKLRLAIYGPSGSGKTWTALLLAQELGSRIAMIDTENGSASKYAGQFDFHSEIMQPPYSPQAYTKLIKSAAEEKFDVLIIDSLSHAWVGVGGALEMADNAEKRTQNRFTAWRDVTPAHNALVEAILSSPIHIITTMRSHTEYVMEQRENKMGKMVTVPKRVGLAPIQRKEIEYEFDVCGEMDQEHNFVVTKTRFADVDGQVINKPGKELGQKLKAWLSDGAPVTKEEPLNPFLHCKTQEELIVEGKKWTGASITSEYRTRLTEMYAKRREELTK